MSIFVLRSLSTPNISPERLLYPGRSDCVWKPLVGRRRPMCLLLNSPPTTQGYLQGPSRISQPRQIRPPEMAEQRRRYPRRPPVPKFRIRQTVRIPAHNGARGRGALTIPKLVSAPANTSPTGPSSSMRRCSCGLSGSRRTRVRRSTTRALLMVSLRTRSRLRCASSLGLGTRSICGR